MYQLKERGGKFDSCTRKLNTNEMNWLNRGISEVYQRRITVGMYTYRVRLKPF